MIIRMLDSMKKDIEIMKKDQSEIKNTISDTPGWGSLGGRGIKQEMIKDSWTCTTMW